MTVFSLEVIPILDRNNVTHYYEDARPFLYYNNDNEFSVLFESRKIKSESFKKSFQIYEKDFKGNLKIVVGYSNAYKKIGYYADPTLLKVNSEDYILFDVKKSLRNGFTKIAYLNSKFDPENKKSIQFLKINDLFYFFRSYHSPEVVQFNDVIYLLLAVSFRAYKWKPYICELIITKKGLTTTKAKKVIITNIIDFEVFSLSQRLSEPFWYQKNNCFIVFLDGAGPSGKFLGSALVFSNDLLTFEIKRLLNPLDFDFYELRFTGNIVINEASILIGAEGKKTPNSNRSIFKIKFSTMVDFDEFINFS